ncbi:MAG: GIY-YIG nuclease family protein [Candidatus Marinimicrobia bacterium]|nr:GIY-YIG nuclease family protein [Candidatus Neomarinimicrobiota bacterium]
MHYLYILFSDSLDKFYVGSSHNPETSLTYHNNSNKGWTKRGRPWRLVFQQGFPNRREAQKVERFVKTQKSTRFIQKVLSGEVELRND